MVATMPHRKRFLDDQEAVQSFHHETRGNSRGRGTSGAVRGTKTHKKIIISFLRVFTADRCGQVNSNRAPPTNNRNMKCKNQNTHATQVIDTQPHTKERIAC